MSAVDAVAKLRHHSASCQCAVGDLIAGVDAVLRIHRRSAFPASRGPDTGRHICLACSTSVDDVTTYMVWPCPTARALGVEA